MCLTVETKYHNKHFIWGKHRNIPKPLVAQEDILVYKWVECDNFNFNHFYTPYQQKVVEFDEKGVAILDSGVKSKKVPFTIFIAPNGRFYVSKGIHSFNSQRKAVHINVFTMNSIIPKGTKFYIGGSGDIVSQKLIIFKTKTDYWEYVNLNCPINMAEYIAKYLFVRK